jgi:aminoglycoside phosphotransferase (APT) family kinase protein
VPVARAVALCNDDSVLGAPFQMVEYVAGQVVRTCTELEALGDEQVIDGCVDALIRVLADLHAVAQEPWGSAISANPRVISNGRSVAGARSGNLCGCPMTTAMLDVQRLRSALHQSIPQHSRTSIVHGDYRIDNTILDARDPRQVRAVVDWELSTLGDPLSDTALMCVYRDPSLDLIINAHAAWTSPLLPVADGLAHRYSSVSGQPLAHWNFYMSLAYFKLAISPPASISAAACQVTRTSTPPTEWGTQWRR